MSLSFIGNIVYILFKILTKREKFYTKTFFNQLDIIGIRAIPVIVLLNFLVGVVLAHQGINTLNDYGQTDKIPDVLIPVYIRYVGSLITSLVVAGRSGSSFAAEIGSMKLSLELDALKSMKINYYAAIIVPRILAMVCFLPILVIFAIISGITGGIVMARFLIEFPMISFMYAVFDLVSFKVVFYTLFKTVFFALTISMIGCYRGLSVHSHFQILGIMTTRSVVECIFWTVILDGIFSTYYAFLGI